MTLQSKLNTASPAVNQPLSVFDRLPDGAWLRLSQLVRSSKNPIAPLPFSPPTLWRKVKDGTFPKPTKLGPRITAWQVADVRGWLKKQVTVRGDE